jgi:hypothetical protein
VDEALRDIERQYRADPTVPNGLRLHQAYLRSGDRERATQLLGELLLQHPRSRQTLRQRTENLIRDFEREDPPVHDPTWGLIDFLQTVLLQERFIHYVHRATGHEGRLRRPIDTDDVLRLDSSNWEATRFTWGPTRDSRETPIWNLANVFIPRELEYSDYYGSASEVANVRHFMANYMDIRGVYQVVGSHGYEGIGLQFNLIATHSIDEDTLHRIGQMLDDLEGLLESHVIDSGLETEVELEQEEEAWNNWVRHDLVRALQRKFHFDWGDPEPTDQQLRNLFEALRSRSNTDWQSEGNSRYIDVERMVRRALKRDVARLGAVFEK